jgi:hypothetical protein
VVAWGVLERLLFNTLSQLDKLMAGFQMQMTSISFVIAFANTIPFMS